MYDFQIANEHNIQLCRGARGTTSMSDKHARTLFKAIFFSKREEYGILHQRWQLVQLL